MSIRAKLVVGDFDGGITDGTIPYSHISSAGTNCTLVKRGQGCLASIIAMNMSASVRYLKLYDTGRPPPAAGVGTPIRRFAIPASTAGRGIVISPKIPFQFYRGLAFTITDGAADTDATAISANDILLTFECAPGAPDAPVTVQSYSTVFPLTENPMSESGVWRQGLTNGLDWTNVQTGLGNDAATHIAYSTMTAHTPPPFNDSIAVLSGFTANHSAQATVYNGSPTGAHECELYLRGTLTANSMTGYEVDIKSSTTGVLLVRWNGALNDFTVLVGETFGGSVSNNDVWYAQIVGTVITVKCNGATIITYDTASDTPKYSSGNPGMGFWHLDGIGSNNEFGFKSFTASNL